MQISGDGEEVEDGSITYSNPLAATGPGTWKKLNHWFGQQRIQHFRQGTFPEVVRMGAFALHTPAMKITSPNSMIMDPLREYSFTGNTLGLIAPEGLYGIDCPSPELVEQLGINDQQALVRVRAQLDRRLSGAGAVASGNVLRSQDGLVRFAAIGNFQACYGIEALAGEEALQMLSKLSARKKLRMRFHGAERREGLAVKVPLFNNGSEMKELSVALARSDDYSQFCSFGGYDSSRAGG